MSGAKIEKFARMANQIGDAFVALPLDEAAKAAASHVRKFWTPKMIEETLAALEGGHIQLNAAATAGFALLRKEFAVAG